MRIHGAETRKLTPAPRCTRPLRWCPCGRPVAGSVRSDPSARCCHSLSDLLNSLIVELLNVVVILSRGQLREQLRMERIGERGHGGGGRFEGRGRERLEEWKGEGKKSETSGAGADVAQRIGPILGVSRSGRRKKSQDSRLQLEIGHCLISFWS